MRIAFDIDGTLTNFEQFIINNKNYIEKKYNLQLKNINGYDVDQMFDIEHSLIDYGLCEEEAKRKSEHILEDFWNRYYFKYCLTPFRKNVKKEINKISKEGHEIYIVSSRKKTCDNDIIGFLVRNSTIIKFKLNGIKYDKIIFLKSDEEKIEYIKSNKIDLLVDDKYELINEISKNINCICITSGYNKYDFNDNVKRVDGFDKKFYDEVNSHDTSENRIKNFYLYKSIKTTERNYKIIRAVGTPFVKALFSPIIINKDNISNHKPTIYAPNHRKTLDPYFVMLSAKNPIHWAALKRFFDGEDSIFNNSKNQFLCKLTSIIFNQMGFIPVNRGGDNTDTRNLTNYCLKNGSCVGIFPEGTTNKQPSEKELLEIKNGILYFAKDNDALIQPISIVWIPKDLKVKNRVIVNYRPPFSMQNLTIEEGREKWIKSILEGINQNKQQIEKISEKIKLKK